MTGATEQKRSFSKGQFTDRNKNTHNKERVADSPLLEAFSLYSKELTLKHDKYERIVKLSRDITVASKRIIFSIHALLKSKNFDEDVKKINEGLKGIRDFQFTAIAKELLNEDSYQFIRAYTWGNQEFIEALTFLRYVTEGRFCGYEEVLEYLDLTQAPVSESGVVEKLPLLIPEMDFVMGLEDMTGELMRHCIDLFSGNYIDKGQGVCNYGRRLYAGLLYLSHTPSWKEHDKKVSIVKQSLEKMEYACYTKHVRGSEAPQPLVDPLSTED